MIVPGPDAKNSMKEEKIGHELCIFASMGWLVLKVVKTPPPLPYMRHNTYIILGVEVTLVKTDHCCLYRLQGVRFQLSTEMEKRQQLSVCGLWSTVLE